MLVGADEFVVHIHTLNLRPNRDVMRHSKALSRRGGGGAEQGGRGEQIEPFTRQYLSQDSERIMRLVVRL